MIFTYINVSLCYKGQISLCMVLPSSVVHGVQHYETTGWVAAAANVSYGAANVS